VKLLAGLGNPGARYADTRHNIGFMVAEQFAAAQNVALKKKGYQGLYGTGSFAGDDLTVLLPQTFMNLSGSSVGAAFKTMRLAPEDLIVVHDDIDLPFGTIRIKAGGGHGGHNGIRNIRQVLGTGDFIRLKIGVGRPEHGDVADYVLRPFSTDEEKSLGAVLANAVEVIESLLLKGVQSAMNEFNSRNISQIKT